ncbi:LytR/AlgR family response regulator transcription factor [Chryseolinea serpens]|nr:response regulator [Chryseolinea serpens]
MNEAPLLCIVIEDEPLGQQVLENYILRMNSLKLVAVCESVDEAFTVLKAQEVDVVFLDMQLKASWGTDLISKLKQRSEHRYYIVITSATLAESIDTKKIFIENHVVLIDHLTKPIAFSSFEAAVNKILSSKT